jgi:transposase
MKLHANAALSLNKRRVLVGRVLEQRWSLTEAAEAAEVSEPTARKWVARYGDEGEAGLLDRPSAANRVHNRTPEDRTEAICALRRIRFTGAEIAEILGMPQTTVSGILTRVGLGRLGRLGLEPPCRYERSRPGELIHIDVKKLGRIQGGAGHRITGRKHYNPTRGPRGRARRTVGWEFVHVCVDDATRLAYAELLGDQKAKTAVAGCYPLYRRSTRPLIKGRPRASILPNSAKKRSAKCGKRGRRPLTGATPAERVALD